MDTLSCPLAPSSVEIGWGSSPARQSSVVTDCDIAVAPNFLCSSKSRLRCSTASASTAYPSAIASGSPSRPLSRKAEDQ